MTYFPIITQSKISRGSGYSSGGITGAVSAVTEKYDDIANTWTAKANLNTAREYLSGFSLNGFGYTAAGDIVTVVSAVTEKYDDIANTWTAKTNVNTARQGPAGFSLNGYGYTAGGTTGAVSAVTEKYDDVANTWTAKTSLNTARNASAGFSLNSYGYTAGGWIAAASAVVEKYDDITNTWTAKTSLNTARSTLAGFSLNGFGYTAGGYTGSGSNVTEKYDDVANTWTSRASTSGYSGIAGFDLNGYGYTVGWVVQKYDDVANTWTTKTAPVTPRDYVAGFSLGNIKEGVQNPDITQIYKANLRLRYNESMIPKATSANLRNSHDAEISTSATGYTKKKTISFLHGLIGSYTVKFDLKTDDITQTAYGKLYKNGTAIGAEKTSVSLVYETQSEDITNSLSIGDTLELWMHTGNGSKSAYAQNFRIYYDDSATVAVQSSNA